MVRPMKGKADPMEPAVHKPNDDDCRCAHCRFNEEEEDE